MLFLQWSISTGKTKMKKSHCLQDGFLSPHRFSMKHFQSTTTCFLSLDKNSNPIYAQRNYIVGDSLFHCFCKSYKKKRLMQKQKMQPIYWLLITFSSTFSRFLAYLSFQTQKTPETGLAQLLPGFKWRIFVMHIHVTSIHLNSLELV